MSIITYFQNVLGSKKCSTCGTQWREIKKCTVCAETLCDKCFSEHKEKHQCSHCEAYFRELHPCTQCSLQFCDDCWPDHPHVERCTVCGIISSSLYSCKVCHQYYCAKCLIAHPEEPITIDNYRVRHTKHDGAHIFLDKNVQTKEEKRQRDLEEGFRG